MTNLSSCPIKGRRALCLIGAYSFEEFRRHVSAKAEISAIVLLASLGPEPLRSEVRNQLREDHNAG